VIREDLAAFPSHPPQPNNESDSPLPIASPQVICKKLKLSQSAFAGPMDVSLRTVRDWEHGRRKPSGPAVTLLRIVEQNPKIFTELS